MFNRIRLPDIAEQLAVFAEGLPPQLLRPQVFSPHPGLQEFAVWIVFAVAVAHSLAND